MYGSCWLAEKWLNLGLVLKYTVKHNTLYCDKPNKNDYRMYMQCFLSNMKIELKQRKTNKINK